MKKNNIIKIWNSDKLPKDWVNIKRAIRIGADASLEKLVKKIIYDVKVQGNKALIQYTKKFDNVSLSSDTLKVTKEEIENAYNSVSPKQINALKRIMEKVETFERQILEKIKITFEKDDISIRYITHPIQSVGCYVPGGEAAYPSTLIMTAALAKVANVPRVVVCSPPNPKGEINPLTLAAAKICKVDVFYKIGGVQAIAALAYGTETINSVKKIVGPGNKYVTMAKMLVSKEIAVDMPAGPSEVLILADENASPYLIALDMISQAEHGEESLAGLITTSNDLAKKVPLELIKICKSAQRSDFVKKSLENHGFIIKCKKEKEMIDLTNSFAPEHVEIMMKNQREVSTKILTAGLILTGNYSAVAFSDYYCGTNHVLPTNGFGHAFSGLSVIDFIRRIGIVNCSKESLLNFKNDVKRITEAENLPNHYNAIKGRFNFKEE